MHRRSWIAAAGVGCLGFVGGVLFQREIGLRAVTRPLGRWLRGPMDYRRAIRGWPVRIVCLGDSITRGWPAAPPEETFLALLQAALRDRGQRVLVINAGVAGQRADEGLARLDQDVLAWQPSIVTILFGTNDCGHDDWENTPAITLDAYRAALREIVGRLRSAGVRPVLMTPPPSARRWSPRPARPRMSSCRSTWKRCATWRVMPGCLSWTSTRTGPSASANDGPTRECGPRIVATPIPMGTA